MYFNHFLKTILSLLLVVSLFSSCNGDTGMPAADPSSIEASSVAAIQVVVLLDLSDRILVKGQIDRDKKIILHLFNRFEGFVKSKLYLRSKDRFKVVIAPQEKSKVDWNLFAEDLYLDMGAHNVDKKKDVFKAFKSAFKDRIDSLFTQAHFSDKPSSYKGADIWRYIKDDLRYDFHNEQKNDQKLLVLISDGYISFESYTNRPGPVDNRYSSTRFFSHLKANTWREQIEEEDWGLLSVNQSFDGLSVLLTEVNPRSINHQFEMLSLVWAKWFQEMGAEVSILRKIAMPGVLEQVNEFF